MFLLSKNTEKKEEEVWGKKYGKKDWKENDLLELHCEGSMLNALSRAIVIGITMHQDSPMCYLSVNQSQAECIDTL